MKKWYRTPLVKIVLIVSVIAASISGAISLVFLLGISDMMPVGSAFSSAGRTYEESETFEGLMYDMMAENLARIQRAEQLESDGKFNPNKLVDIVQYSDTGNITGKNTSGLAYTIDELVKWRKIQYESDNIQNIIVCKKPDGTYHYYYMEEFQSLMDEGILKREADEEANKQFMEDLRNGYYSYDSGLGLTLKDNEGQITYTDCWLFDGDAMLEPFAPDGAANLLEIVNETPDFNGRLSELYSDLRNALDHIPHQIELYENNQNTWKEGNTNFTYLFINKEEKRVYTNNSAFRDYNNAEANVRALTDNTHNKYVIVKPRLKDFQSNIETQAGAWKEQVEGYGFLGEDFLAAAAVDTSYPIQDVFYNTEKTFSEYAPYFEKSIVIFIFSVLVLITAVIWLTLIAGRSAGEVYSADFSDGKKSSESSDGRTEPAEEEPLYLLGFDRWKTELAAAIVIIPWFFLTFGAGTFLSFGYDVSYAGAEILYYVFSISAEDIGLLAVYMALSAVLFLIGYLSLVRRIKAKTLWKNSILRMSFQWIKVCVDFLKEFWRNRKVTLKVAVLFGVFVLIQWSAILFYTDYGYISAFSVLLMLFSQAAAIYILIKEAIGKEKIKEGIRQIASGNVDYQIPLKRMRGDSLDMAERVNNIGNGLQNAVEKSIRSERLKTDLITNVSHDIKTPLTSIINYVDLLRRENLEDPKIQGYLDILEAKSQRLKTLTEDVVEASKVSSGNITLVYMDVNLVEMLNQTIGEFSERMEDRNLRLIAVLPEEPAIIHVDGQRMWRILENIFNNAVKYAMPGTRVYADMKIIGEKVMFSLKNVSEQPLNFSSDELTERFIRGDVSRNTEGSGLGLSIAKSLTEIQGGTFELYLDGDLFKVTIQFSKEFAM